MIIKNAAIFGEDGQFHTGTVSIQKDIFSTVDYGNADPDFSTKEDHALTIDAAGLFMIPGLIDLHFHGCKGADFSDGTVEAIQTLATYEAQAGVTTICPATMTISEEELFKAMEAARNYAGCPEEYGAGFAGIHLEGPFISPEKCGAQPLEYIRPCDDRFFHRLQEASGQQIKIISLAPEMEGAMDFIETNKDAIVISLAHSMADYECALEAFSRGARHVTHLYNGMPDFTHRAPGIAGAAFDHNGCRVELICDGIHVHPSVIRATFRMFGKDRILFISDSLRATGLPDGTYTLGGQDVFVTHGKAVLKNGTIAGSVSTLMDCLRYAVLEARIPFSDALWCATVNPAKELGIFDKCGSIRPGKCADFILLDKTMKIHAVYRNGRKIGK